MAFSKRNSRPITVDGVGFRYCVSFGPQVCKHVFVLNVTVQHISGDGSKLRVTGLQTRDFWLDFPDVGPHDQWVDAYKVVLPSHVSVFVKTAMLNGWTPNIAGPPFELKTDGTLPLAPESDKRGNRLDNLQRERENLMSLCRRLVQG